MKAVWQVMERLGKSAARIVKRAAALAVMAGGCMMCLVACSDDDGDYVPPVQKDMMLVSTDADGVAKRVALDDGTLYDVSAQKLEIADGKTVVRVMGSYTLSAGEMRIYGMEQVYCHSSYWVDSIRVVKGDVVVSGAEHLPRDPVKLISMWKSGAFINLHVGVMTGGDFKSQWVFCEDSVGHYSLVHKRNTDDSEAYTKQVYLSMPVPDGRDSVTFSVKTYSGWARKGFRF